MFCVAARDGTVYYVTNVDRLQAVILVSVFCATALGIIASYALFTIISKRLGGTFHIIDSVLAIVLLESALTLFSCKNFNSQ